MLIAAIVIGFVLIGFPMHLAVSAAPTRAESLRCHRYVGGGKLRPRSSICGASRV